jgi:hypothetical protein
LLLEQVAERDAVRHGERHERADRYVRVAGLDPADVDRVHANRLRGLRLGEFPFQTQGPKPLAKASSFPPCGRDKRGTVSRLRASVPEP